MDDQKPRLTADIETDRLLLRASILAEADVLQAIGEASDYLEPWVGWKTPKDYAYKTLTEGNLPPGGTLENFRAKTICLRATKEAVGVLELYCGLKTPETLLLGWLFILPEHQKRGYAREAIEALISEASKDGFGKIRLGVSLKNWPALRFWQALGFERFAGVLGDDAHSDKTFASAILERDLL